MSDLLVNSEKDLLRRASDGDELAFQHLFLKYHNQLGKHIVRISNSIDLAEEIVQDVFLKIWMSREALAEVHNFKAYLFVISKNHTLNCLRKLTRERIHMKEYEGNFIRSISSEDSDSNIYHSILDEAIYQLPPQQQLAYLLSRHERLRYAEVANRMNISRESVKKYLQIATASITEYVQTNFHSIVILCLLSEFF